MENQNVLSNVREVAAKLAEQERSMAETRIRLTAGVEDYLNGLSKTEIAQIFVHGLFANINASVSPASSAPALVSNVSRNVSASREDPKTLKNRMAFILIDAGKPLSTHEIIEQLVARGWKPKSADLKKYIGVVLPHLSAEKSKATKDTAILRTEHGYVINPDAVLGIGRKGKRVHVSVQDIRNGKVLPGQVETASPAPEPKRKVDVLKRALKMLKDTTDPVTFKAIVDGIKVGGRDFQGHGMSLIRRGVLVKTDKRDGKSSLYEVNKSKIAEILNEAK